MYKIIKVENSKLKNKKMRVYLNDGKHYDFGLYGSETYLNHHDKIKRNNYRKRHYAMEHDFIDNLIPSASLFSYYLLWGDSTDLNKNIIALNKKFSTK